LILFIFPGLIYGEDPKRERIHLESWYQKKWCQEYKGDTTITLNDDTEPDCVTSSHIIEFDFGDKWYESVAQSLHYSLNYMEKRKAGIVLIIEDQVRDDKYWKRLNTVIDAFHLPIDTWTYGNGTGSGVFRRPRSDHTDRTRGSASRKPESSLPGIGKPELSGKPDSTSSGCCTDRISRVEKKCQKMSKNVKKILTGCSVYVIQIMSCGWAMSFGNFSFSTSGNGCHSPILDKRISAVKNRISSGIMLSLIFVATFATEGFAGTIEILAFEYSPSVKADLTGTLQRIVNEAARKCQICHISPETGNENV